MKAHGGQSSTSGLVLQDSHLQSLSMIRGSPNKLCWLASKPMGSTCLSLLGVRINVCTAECRFFLLGSEKRLLMLMAQTF